MLVVYSHARYHSGNTPMGRQYNWGRRRGIEPATSTVRREHSAIGATPAMIMTALFALMAHRSGIEPELPE